MQSAHEIAKVRYEIAKETMKRLQEDRLNCEDESEKYWLLRDIGKLGEELEYLEERMEALDY